jgi:hypothetical protein
LIPLIPEQGTIFRLRSSRSSSIYIRTRIQVIHDGYCTCANTKFFFNESHFTSHAHLYPLCLPQHQLLVPKMTISLTGSIVSRLWLRTLIPLWQPLLPRLRNGTIGFSNFSSQSTRVSTQLAPPPFHSWPPFPRFEYLTKVLQA